MRNLFSALAFALLAPVVISACGSSGSSSAASSAELSDAAFLALSEDEKRIYCEQRVASPEMEKCMQRGMQVPGSMEPLPNWATEEQIKQAMFECERAGEESQTPGELYKCAVERLNGLNQEAAPYTEAQFKAAEEICAKRVTGTVEVQSCVSQMLHEVNTGGM